jgi:hypothetical protein
MLRNQREISFEEMIRIFLKPFIKAEKQRKDIHYLKKKVNDMTDKKRYIAKKELIDTLRSGAVGLIDDPAEEQLLLEKFETGNLIPVKNNK